MERPPTRSDSWNLIRTSWINCGEVGAVGKVKGTKKGKWTLYSVVSQKLRQTYLSILSFCGRFLHPFWTRAVPRKLHSVPSHPLEQSEQSGPSITRCHTFPPSVHVGFHQPSVICSHRRQHKCPREIYRVPSDQVVQYHLLSKSSPGALCIYYYRGVPYLPTLQCLIHSCRYE